MEILNISIVFVFVILLFLLIIGFVVLLLHRFTELWLEGIFKHLFAITLYLFVILFVLVLMRIAIQLL